MLLFITSFFSIFVLLNFSMNVIYFTYSTFYSQKLLASMLFCSFMHKEFVYCYIVIEKNDFDWDPSKTNSRLR